MPDTYHTAGSGGDRHLNFYGDRDNLHDPRRRQDRSSSLRFGRSILTLGSVRRAQPATKEQHI